ncbi:hypothetical protein GGS20DRAFT_558593 [Poronia punctata]|nr:hypothetical protein GGS20DRAFT_558593 [Poronia punctata]
MSAILSDTDESDEQERTPYSILDDRREKLSVKNSFLSRPRQKFLPEGCVRDLVTRDSVITVLGWEDGRLTDSQSVLLSWILDEGRKVFLVHLYQEIGRYNIHHLHMSLSGFKKVNMTDEALLGAEESSLRRYFLSKWGWSRSKLGQLRDNTLWQFYAPVFRAGQVDYDFDAETIFPFTESVEEQRYGAFSVVHKVIIHDAHQDHGFSEVAIKEIILNRAADTIHAAEEEWDIEARNLREMNGLNHAHTVKCLATIRRGQERYFMFPWADGGSLADFFKMTESQEPNEKILDQILQQLRGLADALRHMHDFQESESSDLPEPAVEIELNGQPIAPGQESFRHGDLKPENILRFLRRDEEDSPTNVGTLKLCDMGLAKRHHVGTHYRKSPTSTKYGTRRYEAPDVVTELSRSRQYDIWSMGCITFELIIWTLYGNKKVQEFYKEMDRNSDEQNPYYEASIDGQGRKVKLHPTVRRWIEHLEKHEPECRPDAATAASELLKIVKTKLLVVDLPPHRPSKLGGQIIPGSHFEPPDAGEGRRYYRATAQAFWEALEAIDGQLKLKRISYVLTSTSRQSVLTPDHSSEPRLGMSLRQWRVVDASRRRVDYALRPQADWVFPVDNEFAAQVVRKLGEQVLVPQPNEPATLCQQCGKKNFFRAGYTDTFDRKNLYKRQMDCHLCRLLLDMHRHRSVNRVRLVRTNSMLHTPGCSSTPLLSFVRSPDNEARPNFRPIQVGFPQLPQPGSEVYFALLRLWLEDCDDRHSQCRTSNDLPLPTRLLDIGTTKESKVRLIETRENPPEERRYVALSHPWGDRETHPPFSTLKSSPGRDVASFKQEIPWGQIPATFKDAIITTRGLGIRYLWIDSLCIIQGSDGDFNQESRNMGNVFGGAYCVLAASRATGQHDGFLGKIGHREYLPIKSEGDKTFYICKTIDDFNQHVLEGHLNKRGWVLQERALARRTIYFTEKQTYFECGNGIRCQTLTRMRNEKASFLGDPNFPTKAMKENRGYRIELFQQLYRDYTRLGLTQVWDRPVAVQGLENRLLEAFGCGGKYGIFNDEYGTSNGEPNIGFFHRSLLWRRGKDQPWPPGLMRITFPPERRQTVPTWSWMGYSGGIDYLDVPFNEVIWEKQDISPIMLPEHLDESSPSSVRAQGMGSELRVTVRRFYTSRLEKRELVYDAAGSHCKDGEEYAKGECVVVAKTKDGVVDQQKRYYVLLVQATDLGPVKGESIFERVGVGYMPGTSIIDLDSNAGEKALLG